MTRVQGSSFAQANMIVGTEGDDDLLVTGPAAVDGLGGFDTLHFDFSGSAVGIRLDLGGLWNGGSGWLNGYEIQNVEAVGSSVIGSPIENANIVGSEHDDEIRVGAAYPQRTVIYGLGGNDLLVGSDVDWDSIFGNFLNGGSGNDRVIGGAFMDNLIGEDGDDTLSGNGGNDLLFGDGGRDALSGGDGDDYLRGGADLDELSGGAGDDRLDGSLGDDTLDGGDGTDSAEYYGAEAGVIVDLKAGIARETGASGAHWTDRLEGIENVAGSFFDDVLTGSRGANVLIGDAGADRLRGGGGDDILVGGSGADLLEGGAGADRFVFGADAVDGGEADRIADFRGARGDVIDLSGIDAVSESFEEDAFVLIGDAAFSGAAGELRVSRVAGGWLVAGDVNGDAVGDFAIVVAGATALTAADFVL